MPEWKISNSLVKYNDAIDFMESKVSEIYNNKSDEMVWLLDHEPVYTGGTSSKDSDIINRNVFPIVSTGRGGQYTYHGPGQRIAYIMLDLNKRNQKDIRKFVYNLEQLVINILSIYGIKGERREGRVGVWVIKPDKTEAKIAAIGVRVRKWVTYHGISINLNPDLSHYNNIVPCGISEHGVTSLQDLGINISQQEFDKIFKKEFSKIF